MSQILDVEWSQLKSFVDDRNLTVQWLDIKDIYHVRAFDTTWVLSTRIRQTIPKNADQIDFEDNYQAQGNQTPQNLATITGATDGTRIGNEDDALKVTGVFFEGESIETQPTLDSQAFLNLLLCS